MSVELAQRLTGGPFWQLVRPVMVPGEEQIHHAHLRRVVAGVETSGTLFLTDRRLLWRSIDPTDPAGSVWETSLDDVLGVGRPERFIAFAAFRVVTERGGRPEETAFFPAHHNPADRHLCAQMSALVTQAWRERRLLRSIA